MNDRSDATPQIGRAGRGVSAAWLIPLGALAVAGLIAWRHVADQGALVVVTLESASGVQAGQTPLRFRDVQIGMVETLEFDVGFERVEARLRVDPAAAARMGAETRFWVVRPQVGFAGVSGLDTLLSGSYLATDLAGGQGARPDAYAALPEPPLTPANAPGRRIELVASGGAALSAGAPIYFKSIEVGRIEQRHLSADGGRIEYEAFVTAPYDGWLSRGARFWNASGVSLELNADGVELNMASLPALLRGGVAFDVVARGGAIAQNRFTLYDSEKAARDSVFTDDPAASIRFTAEFTGSVRGLSLGAPVEYRGVRIGEVEDLSVRAGESAGDTRIVATLRLEPARIGFGSSDPGEALAYFARSVGEGMRARLSAGNIVTGALYVELAEMPDMPDAAIDLSGEPFPLIPTAQSQLDALQGGVQDLLTRAKDLPIEALFARAVGTLKNIEAMTADEGFQTAPGELNATLRSARAAIEALDADTLGARLGAAAGSAEGAAKAVEDAAARLPEIARRMEAAAGAARATLGAYGPESRIAADLQSALRDVREAARAVGSLSKTLERRPNSIILGR